MGIKRKLEWAGVASIGFGAVGILICWIYFLCHIGDKNACETIDTFEAWHDKGLKGVVEDVWYGAKGKR